MDENTITEDSKITNETILWRRVHDSHINQVKEHPKIGRVSTGAFKGPKGPRGLKAFSVVITSLTNHTAKEVLNGYNQHSLVSFTVGKAIELNQEVIYSPTPEECGHGDVEGDKPLNTVLRKFVRSYEWVIKPNLEEFDNYISGEEYAEIEDKNSNQ